MINLTQFDVYNESPSIFIINNLSYVIEKDDELIGILKIIPERDNFSIDIGILSDYINKGYGSQALEKVDELVECIDENYRKLIIRTRFSNEAVIKCCRKTGFTYDIEEIERTIYEGENYLVLSKIKNK